MKTVFVDVDTQLDFLYPSGALYVPGAEKIVEQIASVNRFAGAHGIPVISTMDAHAENDPEFQGWPAHCVAGTLGQQKPAATLLERRVVVANRPGAIAIDGAQQILLEKQVLDCFSNVHLNGILDQLGAERYVVYGVVTEICVKFAAEGLLKTGRRVELVTDAVRGLNDSAVAEMTTGFVTRGGLLTTVADVTASQGRRV
ncbi:MAG: cysteine hydrolase [Bryobacterales bacterium]|nr:cysteine hydrolase [Bryobacterales bacterium]